ncbi:DUF2284 domain-containing protein [Thermodesulfobacteriota bacterium]
MQNYEKYISMAKESGMENAVIITPDDIFFDIRAVLKCRWGCEDYFRQSIKCSTRGTTFDERKDMVKSYKDILLLHSHDARDLSKTVLKIERAAFLDGYYFSFGIRYCRLCRECSVDRGENCVTPDRVRPCDESFGIDVYKTAAKQGLPCNVLQNIDDVQNRYGFVLID